MVHPKALSGNTAASAWPPQPSSEAFTIVGNACNEHGDGSSSSDCTLQVSGSSGPAALYAVFRLLQMVRREDPALLQLSTLSLHDTPNTPLRMWDLWDNRDRSVERGYEALSCQQCGSFEFEGTWLEGVLRARWRLCHAPVRNTEVGGPTITNRIPSRVGSKPSHPCIMLTTTNCAVVFHGRRDDVACIH